MADPEDETVRALLALASAQAALEDADLLTPMYGRVTVWRRADAWEVTLYGETATHAVLASAIWESIRVAQLAVQDRRRRLASATLRAIDGANTALCVVLADAPRREESLG